MATAPIQYKSELEPLLAQLMGSKEKTSGSTSSSSTSSTANIDPLQQIFQQQAASSTPAGMEDLIQEVFRIGSQKTPELSAAYANAVGARTSNNSPLALSLAELQRNLAGQAAQLVGKQQESAAQTANGIAQATAGKNTTATTGGSTVTKGAGGGANPLAAAGVLANLADKTGLLGKLKGSLGFGKAGAGVLDANAATAGYDSYDFGGALNTPAAELAPEAASFVLAPSASADFGGGADIGSAFGVTSFGVPDVSSLMGTDLPDFGYNESVGDAIGSAISAPSVDIPDIGYNEVGDLSDATSWFEDLGSFFADGGLVNVADIRGKQQAAKKYADGGAVEGAGVSRGRSNMGPAATQQRSGAMNYQPPVAATPVAQLQSQLSGAATMASRRLPLDGSADSPGVSSTGATATARTVSADGPDMGDQLLGSALNFFGGPVGWGVNQLLNGGSSVEGNIVGQVLPGVVEGVGEGLDTVEEAATGAAQAVGDTVADIAAPIGDAFDNTFGGVVDSIGGFFDMFADGGKIEGAGNGVSDSIPAMLSDGEFVFSKDVVDAVGVDFLQKIQDKYHTPAATQKRTGVK